MPTLNSSILHPPQIFKHPFKPSPPSFISLHNHPSRHPTPTTQDIQLTHPLFQSPNLIPIHLLHHLLIPHQKFLTFNQKRY
ncbi:JAB domain-containing protein, partial [Bacillus altitudinis]|uniref:JAB domain-containing protein n=1 Tax=Bacillus altitudinis TaxID=293387 RepID=UPI003B52270A